MELLRNAFVSNNADISIRDSFEGINAMNKSTHYLDMQFNDETVPERSDFDNSNLQKMAKYFLSPTFTYVDNALLQDYEVDAGVPIWEPPRQRSPEIEFNDTIYSGCKDLENTEGVSEDLVRKE